MYFTYFEKGRGELCFQATYYPFQFQFSMEIPELFVTALN